MLSHSILRGADRAEFQFIGDLLNLCKRHKISCGEPQDLAHLGVDLALNENFCLDLFTLCTAISHMGEADLTPDQLLILLAHAYGGPGVSIRDAVVDIPHAARHAFLNGYETWLTREPDPLPEPSWNTSREQNSPPAPPPGPTLYYSGAARAAAETHNGSPTVRDADNSLPQHSIPGNTPIESLTLNELRRYLEDIESRVSRIEPRLERIGPQRHADRLDSSGAQREQEHVASRRHSDRVDPPEEAQREQEVKTIAPPGPKIDFSPVIRTIDPAPKATVPAAPAKLALANTPASPPTILRQDTFFLNHPSIEKVPDYTAEASPLQRLRIVNSLLLALLIITCAVAASLAYVYLYHPSDTPPVATNRIPAALGTELIPADPTTVVLKPDAAAPAATSIQRPVTTAPEKTRDVAPRPVSPASRAATSTAPTPSSPQTSTKNPAVFIQYPEPAKSAPNPLPSSPSTTNPPLLPKPTSSSTAAVSPPESQNHPQTTVPSSVAQPALNKAQPEGLAAPEATHSLLASAATPRPADTATEATIVRPAKPKDLAVSVPSAMIMTYAVSTPKPIYPSFRHAGSDVTVDVDATISRDGRVTSAQALNGTPDVRGAAVRAVQSWRFKPFILDNSPVEVVTTFKFVFKGQ